MVLSTQGTPTMGWNSWNAFRCYDFDETTILGNADALIELGLAELGYNTVVVDDGWQAPLRDKDGKLVSCAKRFPHGMAWLSKEIHARGLKFGLYLAPGKRTCAQIYDAYGRKLEKVRRKNIASKHTNFNPEEGHEASRENFSPEGLAENFGLEELIAVKPNLFTRLLARMERIKPVPSDSQRLNNLGSWGREASDFAQLLDWEVDYLKYDWCNGNCGTDLCEISAFTKMSDLISQTDREMTYSISEYGKTQPWNWAAEIANSWRTTADIMPTARSIFSIVRKNIEHTSLNQPAAFADPDMLHVGNLRNRELGRSHIRLWGLMNSPLMIGTDLREYKTGDAVIETLRDSAALYLNQHKHISASEIVADDGIFTELRRDLGQEIARLWVNNSRFAKKLVLKTTPRDALAASGQRRIRFFAVGNKYLVQNFSPTSVVDSELNSVSEGFKLNHELRRVFESYCKGETLQIQVPGYSSVVIVAEKTL